MNIKAWTVSISFGSDGELPVVSNEAKQAIMQNVAGSCPLLVTGDDHLGLTFDVRARDIETAFVVAKTTADDALLAAGLPVIPIEQVSISSESRRKRDDMRIPDLVGVSEIAQLFGVTRQRAWQLSQAKSFPSAVCELKSGPVWSKRRIVLWNALSRSQKLERKPSLDTA